jgi:hypothetical protein
MDKTCEGADTGSGCDSEVRTKSLVRHCEVCGVSGMNIEVREIWHDGMYFGTFCGRCELRRTGGTKCPPGRRAQS